MSQNIINTGQAANDGTGEPLRQAFTDINNNFSQIWTAGPVNSNVQITNNKIATLQTNQNLVLAPNGVGVVQANTSVVPDISHLRDLGSSAKTWDTVWADYVNVQSANIAGDIEVGGNLLVDGNLQVNGNVTYIDSTIVDIADKNITLAYGSPTAQTANGGGITIAGANAQLYYNYSNNSWTTNLSFAPPNITFPDGSVLNTANTVHIGQTPIVKGDGNLWFNSDDGRGYIKYNNQWIEFSPTVIPNPATYLGNLTIDGENNSTLYFPPGGSIVFGDDTVQTTAYTGGGSYGNANVSALLANFGSNSISTTGNISAGHIFGNLQAPNGNTAVIFNDNGFMGTDIGFSYDKSDHTLFARTGTFSGLANTGVQGLYVGNPNYSILGSDVLAQFTSNVDAYSQINLQNINAGNFSSADYIITGDQGTDSTYFLDLGLAGSNYLYTGYGAIGPSDGYLFVAGADQTGPFTGTANLNIGSTNGAVRTWIGAGELANIVTTVGPDGLSVTGNIIPTTSNVYSLGNSTNWWANAWFGSNTIYIGGVPVGVSGNTLTVAGANVVTTAAGAAGSSGDIQINVDGGLGTDSSLRYVDNSGEMTLYADYLNAPGIFTSDIYAGDGTPSNITLTTSYGNATWTFGTDGNLAVPGNMVINGNVNVFGTDTALIQPTNNVPLALISSGPNAGTTTFWVENISDPANSAIAGMYAPLAGTANVGIVTGNNATTVNFWNFDSTGNLTIPGSLLLAGDIGPSTMASPAPSINGFASVNAINFSASGNVTVSGLISAVGNVTGNYFIGNGSLLTGISSGTSSLLANGAAQFTLLSDNTLLSGNVASPQNFKVNDVYTPDVDLRNASGTGSFTQGANLTLRTAGTYNWNFSNDGTLTLPNSTIIKTTSDSALAIGVGAGTGGSSAVSLGSSAGANAQSFDAIAIGGQAGANTQGGAAVAVGASAGNDAQGVGAIAIGSFAGKINQGESAIAIGAAAGETNQGNNSIILNASGATLDNTNPNTFTVKPVRGDSTANLVSGGFKAVYYNPTTGEFAYSTD